MYSPDRYEALTYTLSCLEDMNLYEHCQKTLVVDGKIDQIPPDWEVIQVPRIANKFCWGRMWDAGVYSAKFEKILYLDSDRLLPKNTLQLINSYLEDDIFLFTSMHFLMENIISIEACKTLLSFEDIDRMLIEASEIGCLRYEVRHKEPFHGAGKNVMSGSTAFTKKTYSRLGGVDQWYHGHGAFADSDFHMQAAVEGCSFFDLGLQELHFPHAKLDESKKALANEDLYKLGLDNFIYYCHKWRLPNSLVESYATRAGISRPATYIAKRAKEILG